MAACLQCGKKTETDYILWKGGVNQALCEACRLVEDSKYSGEKSPQKKTIVSNIL